MKFNSQICTTKEQSEKLLALGLKKETADMMYCKTTYGESITVKDDDYLEHLDFPTWSLHRLIEISKQRAISPFSDIGGLYDDIIATIQSLIHLRYIKEEYLDMDIVNARESENTELLKK